MCQALYLWWAALLIPMWYIISSHPHDAIARGWCCRHFKGEDTDTKNISLRSHNQYILEPQFNSNSALEPKAILVLLDRRF